MRLLALLTPRPTAVVILGWRLELIVNNPRGNQLSSVCTLLQCFAQLEGNRPFVACIVIMPIAKG